MKKNLMFIIALLFVGLFTLPCFAATTPTYGGGLGMGSLRTAVSINNSAGYATTLLDTASELVPGKTQIIGWEIATLPNGASYTTTTAGTWAQLQDTTTAAIAALYPLGEVIAGEAEATLGSVYYRLFPNPIELRLGLVIAQGPYSVVTIYYQQVRP